MLHPPSKRNSEQGQLTPVERARVRTGSASAATRARMEILARNYEIAIENLTSHLLSFPEDFNALNCRIAAYKRAGRLENALEDAKALQRLNPGSAKSYIWMAEIHLARRQYEKASEALVFALANVSDKSQLYWRLQELAFIVSRRRFDFLHTVPNEILTCILSQLSFQDRITLLDVSKAWRQYLINWIDFCGCTESRCEASLDQEYIVEYLKKGGRGIRRCFLFTDALDVIEKEYIVKNQCCYIEELSKCSLPTSLLAFYSHEDVESNRRLSRAGFQRFGEEIFDKDFGIFKQLADQLVVGILQSVSELYNGGCTRYLH